MSVCNSFFFLFISRNTIVILIYFLSICLLNVYFRTLYTNTHTHFYLQEQNKNQTEENLKRRSTIQDQIVPLSNILFVVVCNKTITIVFFFSITIKSFIMTKVFVRSLTLSHLRKKRRKERERIEERKVPLSLRLHFLSYTLMNGVDKREGLFRFASLNKIYSQRKLDSWEAKDVTY
jgi:hypothetical protein